MQTSEIDDFKQLLTQYGLQDEAGEDWENYWDLKDIDDTAYKSDRLSPLKGRVIVTRKSNGAHKTYDHSNGSAWIVNFKNDLVSGHFN
ncbi:MAG: hypothetical protein M3R00_09470 [Pseudomonadota bacterium]|nr:hypothetical protein [Pseudomonadota bacterium]